MVKALGLTVDYVLHEMSYANLHLYSASLPTYTPKKRNDKHRGSDSGDDRVIKADDPRNRHLVRQVLEEL